MKRILFFIMAFFSLQTFAQNRLLQSERVEVKDSVKVAGIWYKDFIIKTANVSGLPNLSVINGAQAIVADSIRGGSFTWFPSSSNLTTDNGVIFAASGGGYWVRNYSHGDGVKVTWYDNGTGDSLTNNTNAFKKAIQRIETTSATSSGGKIIVPKGNYFLDSLYIGESGNKARITIEGEGATTTLWLRNNINTNLITIAGGYCNITNIALKGNRDNQTSGSVIKVLNGGDFLRLEKVRVSGGKNYGIEIYGSGQVVSDQSFFFDNNKGGYVTNSQVTFTNQTTFEDNDSVGLFIQGSNSSMNVTINGGTRFENNGNYGLTSPAYHIQLSGLQDVSKVSIRDCYFNGQQSDTAQYGIGFTGSNQMINGVVINGNTFKYCTKGALFFDPTIPASHFGENDFSFNNYNFNTPIPAKNAYTGFFQQNLINQYSWMYLPNQDNGTGFYGTYILGNGGRNITHTNGTSQGQENTIVGIGAYTNATYPLGNTAIGFNAMFSDSTGNNNTAIGRKVLYYNRTGINNTATGWETGYGAQYSSDISGNTLYGVRSGYSLLTGGDNNTFIGYNAGDSSTTASSSVVLGYDRQLQSKTNAGQMDLKGGIFGTGLTATGQSISTTGKLGIFVATPTAGLHLRGSTSGFSGLRIENGVRPSSPNEGDIWVENLGVYAQQGGVVKKLDNDNRTMQLKAFYALGSSVVAEPVLTSVKDITTSLSLTSQQLNLTAIWVYGTTTLQGVKFYQNTTGDYTASNYNGFGLYTISGGVLTLVASTPDDGNIFKGAANTFVSKDFTSPYTASEGVYYIGLLYSSSAVVTGPTVGRSSTLLTSGVSVVDFTNSGKLAATKSTQTSLPSSVNISSFNNSNNTSFWVGLYANGGAL